MTKICLAPMLDVTTPPFCQLIRLINPDVELFSEMMVDNMIINANSALLDERVANYPLNTVIQIGGSEPRKISIAIQTLHIKYRYTKFNLNCGCPSSKVKKGAFGAILMKDPQNVANIINQVHADKNIIISVKCRIGIIESSDEKNKDEYVVDDFELLFNFFYIITKNTRCRKFYVHCRKCILDGMSPKSNRTVPELMHFYAHRLKTIFNDCEIIINGGIKLPYDKQVLQNCDGVMIGRMAMEQPLCFRSFISEQEKAEFIIALIPQYLESLNIKSRLRMYHILPIMNLCKGMRNAKVYKQILISAIRTNMQQDELSKQIIDYIKQNMFFDIEKQMGQISL